MSDFAIKDGTGSGYRAQVDLDHRIRVRATASADIEFNSTKYGTAFNFLSVENSITSGSEYHVLWLKNTDTNRKLHINTIYVSYNGGNTNHNRVLINRIRFGSSTPSANNTTTTGNNLNLVNSNSALVEAYYWNGVGAGMTISGNGPVILSSYFGNGFNHIDFQGALLLGYNQVLDFTIQAEETGIASIVLTGWFNNIV